MLPVLAPVLGTFGPRSVGEMLRVLAAPEAARCGLVELRLDLVPGAREALPQLVAASPVPVLATCRRPADGGAFEGGEDVRLGLLAAAAAAGAAWLDVEDDVPDDAVPLRPGTRVLRSAHVPRLPADVDALAARLLRAPADAAKLVAIDGDEHDAARLLRLVRSLSGRLVGHIVAVPFTRPASVLAGAPFTYAALRPGGRIDLALPTVHDLLDRAGLARAGPRSRAWVLLGADVERSVSPEMLNRAFGLAGADVVALRWSCADPRPALDLLVDLGWAGAAVTIPHKETVLDALRNRGAQIGAEAQQVGAVNTVLVRDGNLLGGNTDADGLRDALADALPHGLGGRVGLVLGAGGAARAAVVAVRRLGGRPVVYARRPEAAEDLRAIGADGVARTADDAVATRPALVVDATPAGPPGGVPFLDVGRLTEPAVVLDMLVAGRRTALLAAADAAGHRCVAGLAMLACQASRQVEHLLGQPADVEDICGLGGEILAARRRNVVLLGLRCSGKSALGRALAPLVGREFVDVDDEIARVSGRTPDEWISRGAESAFRRLEAEAMERLGGTYGNVVACGGGAALSPQALARLVRDAVVVHLDAPDDFLLARLGNAPRAALTGLAPAEELARQRAQRSVVYAAAATWSVDTSERDVLEVAEALAADIEREMPDPLRWLSVP